MCDWLLRDGLGALRYPLDVVVGEFSGRLRSELDALGGRVGTAISIDKRPTELPGLHYCGDAQDILYERSWRRLYSFVPCTDDALSGAQYFPAKAADGRLWRGLKFFLWTMCAPAEAAVAEHPRSVLKHMIDWPYQVTQPHQFGLGDTGLAEQKETWLYWRGWSEIQPTDPQPPPYVSRVKSVREASSSDRDAIKSRSHLGMMRAIAAHTAVAQIVTTPRPDFATELQRLGSRFAERYGADNRPADWAVPHVVAPAWAATSIAYAPSPDARAAADPGVIFVGAHLAAVNGKGSLRVTNSDHRSTGNDDRQVNNIPVLVTDAHARHGR